MLGVLGNSGDGAAAAEGVVGGEEGAVGTSMSEEEKVRMEEGERSMGGGGGNRWPRQETLALLKIRSDMDAAFRDSSLKGPLWEEVSRKLAELGFHRSAKKCKEKFENVYKYHKRTKEGRSTKSDGKTYRFFDQLQALENQPNSMQFLSPVPQSQPQVMPIAVANPLPPPMVSQVSIPPIPNPINPLLSNQPPPPPPPNPTINTRIASSHHFKMPEYSASMSTSSSSTSSEEDPERRRKRKRKWEAFFQRLMMEVVQKQEEMQKKFLETLERRERDRVAREEAWRAQEMARMNREHDLLAHERSIATTKDAAVIAFLQKVSDQPIPNAPQIQIQMQEPPIRHVPPPAVQPQPQPQSQPSQLAIQPAANSLETPKKDNGGNNTNFLPTSSSRWPKTEVEALIKIRTDLDSKYQEGGPKGPLWEEISAEMRKVGYNRNAKRCKEKWENINKYFKKVKESNKKRPEDSKTCPYFHQLNALYKEKTSKMGHDGTSSTLDPMVPIMVQPEQQWPLLQENEHNNNHDSGEDEEEEDEAGGYEIVPNKASSVGTGE